MCFYGGGCSAGGDGRPGPVTVLLLAAFVVVALVRTRRRNARLSGAYGAMQPFDRQRPGPVGRAPGDREATERAGVEPDRPFEPVGDREARRASRLQLADGLRGELAHHAPGAARGRTRSGRRRRSRSPRRRGATNDGGWPATSASPFDTIRTRGPSVHEVGQRADVARRGLAGAGAGSCRAAGARPAGTEAEAGRARSARWRCAGNTVTAASTLASGSGIWFGFAMWKRRSNATLMVSRTGRGPKSCWHSSAAPCRTAPTRASGQ